MESASILRTLRLSLNIASYFGAALNKIDSTNGELVVSLKAEVPFCHWKINKIYLILFWEVFNLVSGCWSILELYLWLEHSRSPEVAIDKLLHFLGIVFHGTRVLSNLGDIPALLTLHFYPEVIAWVYNNMITESRGQLEKKRKYNTQIKTLVP